MAALGRPITALVCLRGRERAEGALERALRERRDLPTEEGHFDDGLGGSRTLLETASLVLDGPELLGAVSVLRDVTEQRRLERRIAATDRLTALGTIAAGIAHEINNPLAVLAGHTDLLLETLQSRRDELPTAARTERSALDEMIEGQIDCVEAVRRIAHVIGALRGFATGRGTDHASADIARTIEVAVRQTASTRTGRARIVIDDAVPGARAAIAAPHLEQVLWQLLRNAAEATPLGRPDAHPITIAVRRTDERVTIEVRDRGEGIPSEIVRRVFEPFFTTREVGRGSGLGLAICHGLVTAAGGEIDCEGEVGQGAVFRVTLREAPR